MGFEISEQQICQFKADGYLVLPSVFDLSEVKAMREEANFILELMVNSSLYHQRKSGRGYSSDSHWADCAKNTTD